jgi:hypothetical protein
VQRVQEAVRALTIGAEALGRELEREGQESRRGDGRQQEWACPCPTLPQCPSGTHLHEAGVHGGCGADHVDVGSGRGADALQGGVGWDREGEVLRVAELGAGADGGKAVKTLQNESERQESPCLPP